MNVLGTRAAMSFSAEPDIKDWADRVALNPARIPPGTSRIGGLGRRARAPGDPHASWTGQARRAHLSGFGGTAQRVPYWMIRTGLRLRAASPLASSSRCGRS